jgi:large subunit ribosomal protein L6
LKIGYSHEVIYPIPADVSIVCSKAKGTILLIKGVELYRVRQVAAEIRALHLPDAYKGKGIHYNKEVLRLKKGKREGK